MEGEAHEAKDRFIDETVRDAWEGGCRGMITCKIDMMSIRGPRNGG